MSTTIDMSFDTLIRLPIIEMSNSNMIPMIRLDDEMKLGLYYLMSIYHLGFHHCVRGDWEWVMVSPADDDRKWLKGPEIEELEMDMEVYHTLKSDFDNGILPEGYVRMKEQREEISSVDFEYTGQFGWLSPTGKFTPSDWGCHEEDAYKIIESNGFMDDYETWDGVRGSEILRLARDYLVYAKGYVLIHNPSNDGGYIVTDYKPMTKKQKEFLYDYFMAIGNGMRAAHYLED